MGVVRDALSVFCTLAPCDARQSVCARRWRAFIARAHIDAAEYV